MPAIEVESVVRERYRQGAQERVADLCCPVSYDPRYLAAIPQEVLERDYGCGDPSRHLRPGETVLDLGSGTGKICFIAAQVVGPEGRVIGVDMTDEMLDVARRNAPILADRLGYANVELRRGLIQDLALDLDLLDATLAREPVTSAEGLRRAASLADELRRTRPLIADGEVDAVVSNCVLNLVEAFKGKEGPCFERRQAVIYKGPFREVLDDDGHRMRRGERYAVCDKTFRLYQQEPYRGFFVPVEPLEAVPLDSAPPFDCTRIALRHPRETKGQDYQVTTETKACEPGSCC